MAESGHVQSIARLRRVVADLVSGATHMPAEAPDRVL